MRHVFITRRDLKEKNKEAAQTRQIKELLKQETESTGLTVRCQLKVKKSAIVSGLGKKKKMTFFPIDPENVRNVLGTLHPENLGFLCSRVI